MKSEVIYRCGEYAYAFEPNFVAWPVGVGMPQVCGLQVWDGELYVANRSVQYPIAVMDLNGRFLRGFGRELEFGRAHGLSIDRKGRLFVCDDPHQVIHCLDAKTGRPLTTIGQRDKCCDNGYDPSMPWPYDLFTIKRMGEPFNHPTRMLEAPDGTYYISDGYANVAVHHFDQDFRLLHSFGGVGDGHGAFRLPHSLWVDPRGRVWVADRENFKLQIFAGDGAFLKEFDHLLYPSEPWGDGKYVYLIEGYGRLSIFDDDLECVAQIGYNGSPLNGHSICGDKNGDLYIGHIHGDCTLTKLRRL